MTTTASTRHRGHPITVAAAEIEDLLDELVEQSTWSMQDDETRATLTRLSRAEARVAELKLRVAAHGEKNRIGDASGASSTANWWAHATKTTRAATHRDVKLAKALDTDAHEPVRRALAAGEILVDQAAVIVRAVDALPADAEAWVAPKAQQWLLDQATRPRRQDPADPGETDPGGRRPRRSRRPRSQTVGAGRTGR